MGGIVAGGQQHNFAAGQHRLARTEHAHPRKPLQKNRAIALMVAQCFVNYKTVDIAC
jgi:hypothetical protein